MSEQFDFLENVKGASAAAFQFTHEEGADLGISNKRPDDFRFERDKITRADAPGRKVSGLFEGDFKRARKIEGGFEYKLRDGRTLRLNAAGRQFGPNQIKNEFKSLFDADDKATKAWHKFVENHGTPDKPGHKKAIPKWTGVQVRKVSGGYEARFNEFSRDPNTPIRKIRLMADGQVMSAFERAKLVKAGVIGEFAPLAHKQPINDPTRFLPASGLAARGALEAEARGIAKDINGILVETGFLKIDKKGAIKHMDGMKDKRPRIEPEVILGLQKRLGRHMKRLREIETRLLTKIRSATLTIGDDDYGMPAAEYAHAEGQIRRISKQLGDQASEGLRIDKRVKDFEKAVLRGADNPTKAARVSGFVRGGIEISESEGTPHSLANPKLELFKKRSSALAASGKTTIAEAGISQNVRDRIYEALRHPDPKTEKMLTKGYFSSFQSLAKVQMAINTTRAFMGSALRMGTHMAVPVVATMLLEEVAEAADIKSDGELIEKIKVTADGAYQLVSAQVPEMRDLIGRPRYKENELIHNVIGLGQPGIDDYNATITMNELRFGTNKIRRHMKAAAEIDKGFDPTKDLTELSARLGPLAQGIRTGVPEPENVKRQADRAINTMRGIQTSLVLGVQKATQDLELVLKVSEPLLKLNPKYRDYVQVAKEHRDAGVKFEEGFKKRDPVARFRKLGKEVTAETVGELWKESRKVMKNLAFVGAEVANFTLGKIDDSFSMVGVDPRLGTDIGVPDVRDEGTLASEKLAKAEMETGHFDSIQARTRMMKQTTARGNAFKRMTPSELRKEFGGKNPNMNLMNTALDAANFWTRVVFAYTGTLQDPELRAKIDLNDHDDFPFLDTNFGEIYSKNFSSPEARDFRFSQQHMFNLFGRMVYAYTKMGEAAFKYPASRKGEKQIFVPGLTEFSMFWRSAALAENFHDVLNSPEAYQYIEDNPALFDIPISIVADFMNPAFIGITKYREIRRFGLQIVTDGKPHLYEGQIQKFIKNVRKQPVTSPSVYAAVETEMTNGAMSPQIIDEFKRAIKKPPKGSNSAIEIDRVMTAYGYEFKGSVMSAFVASSVGQHLFDPLDTTVAPPSSNRIIGGHNQLRDYHKQLVTQGVAQDDRLRAAASQLTTQDRADLVYYLNNYVSRAQYAAEVKSQIRVPHSKALRHFITTWDDVAKYDLVGRAKDYKHGRITREKVLALLLEDAGVRLRGDGEARRQAFALATRVGEDIKKGVSEVYVGTNPNMAQQIKNSGKFPEGKDIPFSFSYEDAVARSKESIDELVDTTLGFADFGKKRITISKANIQKYLDQHGSLEGIGFMAPGQGKLITTLDGAIEHIELHELAHVLIGPKGVKAGPKATEQVANEIALDAGRGGMKFLSKESRAAKRAELIKNAQDNGWHIFTTKEKLLRPQQSRKFIVRGDRTVIGEPKDGVLKVRIQLPAKLRKDAKPKSDFSYVIDGADLNKRTIIKPEQIRFIPPEQALVPADIKLSNVFKQKATLREQSHFGVMAPFVKELDVSTAKFNRLVERRNILLGTKTGSESNLNSFKRALSKNRKSFPAVKDDKGVLHDTNKESLRLRAEIEEETLRLNTSQKHLDDLQPMIQQADEAVESAMSNHRTALELAPPLLQDVAQKPMQVVDALTGKRIIASKETEEKIRRLLAPEPIGTELLFTDMRNIVRENPKMADRLLDPNRPYMSGFLQAATGQPKRAQQLKNMGEEAFRRTIMKDMTDSDIADGIVKMIKDLTERRPKEFAKSAFDNMLHAAQKNLAETKARDVKHFISPEKKNTLVRHLENIVKSIESKANPEAQNAAIRFYDVTMRTIKQGWLYGTPRWYTLNFIDNLAKNGITVPMWEWDLADKISMPIAGAPFNFSRGFTGLVPKTARGSSIDVGKLKISGLSDIPGLRTVGAGAEALSGLIEDKTRTQLGKWAYAKRISELEKNWIAQNPATRKASLGNKTGMAFLEKDGKKVVGGKLREEWDLSARLFADQMISKVQFFNADLTNFAQGVERIVPFGGTFALDNFRFWHQEALDHPVASAFLIRTLNNIKEKMNTDAQGRIKIGTSNYRMDPFDLFALQNVRDFYENVSLSRFVYSRGEDRQVVLDKTATAISGWRMLTSGANAFSRGVPPQFRMVADLFKGTAFIPRGNDYEAFATRKERRDLIFNSKSLVATSFDQWSQVSTGLPLEAAWARLNGLDEDELPTEILRWQVALEQGKARMLFENISQDEALDRAMEYIQRNAILRIFGLPIVWDPKDKGELLRLARDRYARSTTEQQERFYNENPWIHDFVNPPGEGKNETNRTIREIEDAGNDFEKFKKATEDIDKMNQLREDVPSFYRDKVVPIFENFKKQGRLFIHDLVHGTGVAQAAVPEKQKTIKAQAEDIWNRPAQGNNPPVRKEQPVETEVPEDKYLEGISKQVESKGAAVVSSVPAPPQVPEIFIELGPKDAALSDVLETESGGLTKAEAADRVPDRIKSDTNPTQYKIPYPRPETLRSWIITIDGYTTPGKLLPIGPGGKLVKLTEKQRKKASRADVGISRLMDKVSTLVETLRDMDDFEKFNTGKMMLRGELVDFTPLLEKITMEYKDGKKESTILGHMLHNKRLQRDLTGRGKSKAEWGTNEDKLFNWFWNEVPPSGLVTAQKIKESAKLREADSLIEPAKRWLEDGRRIWDDRRNKTDLIDAEIAKRISEGAPGFPKDLVKRLHDTGNGKLFADYAFARRFDNFQDLKSILIQKDEKGRDVFNTQRAGGYIGTHLPELQMLAAVNRDAKEYLERENIPIDHKSTRMEAATIDSELNPWGGDNFDIGPDVISQYPFIYDERLLTPEERERSRASRISAIADTVPLLEVVRDIIKKTKKPSSPPDKAGTDADVEKQRTVREQERDEPERPLLPRPSFAPSDPLSNITSEDNFTRTVNQALLGLDEKIAERRLYQEPARPFRGPGQYLTHVTQQATRAKQEFELAIEQQSLRFTNKVDRERFKNMARADKPQPNFFTAAEHFLKDLPVAQTARSVRGVLGMASNLGIIDDDSFRTLNRALVQSDLQGQGFAAASSVINVVASIRNVETFGQARQRLLKDLHGTDKAKALKAQSTLKSSGLFQVGSEALSIASGVAGAEGSTELAGALGGASGLASGLALIQTTATATGFNPYAIAAAVAFTAIGTLTGLSSGKASNRAKRERREAEEQRVISRREAEAARQARIREAQRQQSVRSLSGNQRLLAAAVGAGNQQPQQVERLARFFRRPQIQSGTGLAQQAERQGQRQFRPNF